MHYSVRLMCAALALGPFPAAANPFIPTADIDAAVARFLGAPAGSPGGAARAVDPRLKLATCSDNLEVSWYGRSGASLRVSCPARGWRVFVPVTGGRPASAENGMGESIVQKGETVSIVYEGSGFTLTRQGEALEPGAQDQWIKVRPAGDKTRPVSGQVLRPGVVSVLAD